MTPVRIVLIGKYTVLSDAYLSVIKALQHACMAAGLKLQLQWWGLWGGVGGWGVGRQGCRGASSRVPRVRARWSLPGHSPPPPASYVPTSPQPQNAH